MRGKVRAIGGPLSFPEDHPRACGEKPFTEWPLSYPTGSPPRMRGKAEKNSVFCPGVGITPAHAGKSCSTTCRTCAPRDHPRACGEKTKKIP